MKPDIQICLSVFFMPIFSSSCSHSQRGPHNVIGAASQCLASVWIFITFFFCVAPEKLSCDNTVTINPMREERNKVFRRTGVQRTMPQCLNASPALPGAFSVHLSAHLREVPGPPGIFVRGPGERRKKCNRLLSQRWHAEKIRGFFWGGYFFHFSRLIDWNQMERIRPSKSGAASPAPAWESRGAGDVGAGKAVKGINVWRWISQQRHKSSEKK